MKELGAHESNLKQCDTLHANRRLAFVRDPVVRFFSQYEEMIARYEERRGIETSKH